MPPTVRIVYQGPFDAVDVPAVGLTGIRPGEPVEVGASIAETVLAHPDWRVADEPIQAAPAAVDAPQEV